MYTYFNVLAGGMEDLQKAVPTQRLGLKKLKTFAAQAAQLEGWWNLIFIS